jgi:hypothetical protein
MKRTRSKKSRDTVPLKSILPFLLQQDSGLKIAGPKKAVGSTKQALNLN